MNPSAHDQQRSVSTVGQYNAAGTQISTTVCLVHDALGRLTAVGLAKAVLPSPGAYYCQSENDIMSFSARFEYDAMNRRVARQDGTAWTEYVHDPGGNLLAELARPVSGSWTTVREYAWLDGQPLAQLEYLQSRAAPYLYYFHLDHLGQPRALTNETGSTTVWSAIPARPYGDVAEATTQDPLNGKTVVTNLRLPGQYDERLFTAAGLTGLQGPYYNWNRWYLPTLGRYMELDPIAVAGGFNGPWGPNWYGYAEGNPLRYVDSRGLTWWDNRYGFPDEFWRWYHRNGKGDAPDIDYKDAKEAYDEWIRQGKPPSDNKGPRPPAKVPPFFDPFDFDVFPIIIINPCSLNPDWCLPPKPKEDIACSPGK